MSGVKIDQSLIKKVAEMAALEVSDEESQVLAKQFNQTMEVVNELAHIDTKDVEPTYQVNDLQNVWREDKINLETQFSQAEALQGAKKTHQGYFVVERIIDHEA